MQNLEKKEQMIMMDGNFSAMIQQHEEDKAQKSNGERTAVHVINSDGEGFGSCSEFPFPATIFLQYFISQNFGGPLKSNNLGKWMVCFSP